MTRPDREGDLAALFAQGNWEPCSASFILKRRGVVDPDFVVTDHGSIFVVYPRSQAAQKWWRDHVQPGASNLRRNFIVEHRFVQDILDALYRDGFVAVSRGGYNA